MLLTKKKLKEILKNMRISIPESVEKERLNQYGNYDTNDEGHIYEYTKQDIYEQLRRSFAPYEKSCICDFIISADAKLI